MIKVYETIMAKLWVRQIDVGKLSNIKPIQTPTIDLKPKDRKKI